MMSLEGVEFKDYRWQRPANCVLEKTIDKLTAALRSKPEWRRKIEDEGIVNKWRNEAADQGISGDDFQFAMKVLAPGSTSPLRQINSDTTPTNTFIVDAVADAVVRDDGYGERAGVARAWRISGRQDPLR